MTPPPPHHRFSLVTPDKETLEAGLSRELQEELGMDLPVSAEDYVYCHIAPPRAGSHSSNLLLHFYVKKVDEQQVLEAERAAVTAAIDHGDEVTPAAFLGGGGFRPRAFCIV